MYILFHVITLQEASCMADAFVLSAVKELVENMGKDSVSSKAYSRLGS